MIILKKRDSKFRWVVFATVLFTYLIMSSQRTAPGLITDQLMLEFQLTASVAGILASAHFLMYASLQIPMGILVNRYGPNIILLLGALLTGVGMVLYSLSPNEILLMMARFLTGLGDATVWVSLVLILSQWFYPKEFTKLIGFAGMFGSLGFLMATIPLSAWISVQGWRIPFFVLGTILMICFFLIYLVLYRIPSKLSLNTRSRQLKSEREKLIPQLKRILSKRQTIALFFCHFGIVGGYVGLISSWAVPYGMDMYNMSRSGASQLIMTSLIGAIIGAPFGSWISSRLGTIKRPYLIIHLITVFCWLVFVIFTGKPPMILLFFLFFVIGFGFGTSALTFAIVRQSFSYNDSGIVSGVANTGGFLSAVLLPSIFGTILNYFQQTTGNVLDGYVFGFISPVVFSILGLIGISLVTEKELVRERNK